MNDVILWTVWFGLLATLPPMMTRLLMKHAMAKGRGVRRPVWGRRKKEG
ncbi:MAG: hypothetical protein QM706_02715 [Nitrospira sp.]